MLEPSLLLFAVYSIKDDWTLKLYRCISTLLLIIFSTYTFSALPENFTIDRLGLFEEENIKSDGSFFSYLHDTNNAGYVTGFSELYKGSSVAGYATWVFDGDALVRIGLFEGLHIGEGYQNSSIRNLSSNGNVVGNSFQYSGRRKSGQSAWFYNGIETQSIGLSDNVHTNFIGYRESNVIKLNDFGQAIGTSKRYKDRLPVGHTAWLYSNGVTKRIGLIDREHTSPVNNEQSSKPHFINDSGYVTGVSTRYGNDAKSRKSIGQSPWVYDGIKTQRIGLIDREHTRDNGYRFSTITNLNELGQVAGNTKRYIGNSGSGWSAWIYSSGNINRIGLIDTEHTRDNGSQNSSVAALNNSGNAIGSSTRLGGHEFTGESAWVYEKNKTTRIGLYDSEHSRNDGYQGSKARYLNDEGYATGTSNRYSGNLEIGKSAWVYKENKTKRIGLTDPQHTRADGYQETFAHFPNMSGQLVGRSQRFKGDKNNGQTAWFYDFKSDKTIELNMSESSEGYAYSLAHYLSDDGLVLGTYSLFGEDDELLGQRAFYFTIEDGMQDLGDLAFNLGLDLSNYDWASLASAKSSANSDYIAGNGKTLSGSRAVYLLKLPSEHPMLSLPLIAWSGVFVCIIFLGIWYRKKYS